MKDNELQDALILRSKIANAIDWANIAVGGAITERRDTFFFGNLRGDLEDTLIKLDFEAKMRFGERYNP